MIAEKDFATRQSRGARSLQEDAYAFSEIADAAGRMEGLLVVVADGMGGHNAGERASDLALKSFIAAFHATGGALGKRMRKALTAANEAIAAELRREPDCEGMGTTLLAAAITPTGIEWVSVGDSPLYLWSGATLTRLNADHSLRPVLNEMAERGEISGSGPGQHVSGNILRAALTGDEIALIDQSRGPVKFEQGDLVLAATDGIHTLNDHEIAANRGQPAASASVLAGNVLRAVLDVQNPKQDNTTIAIVKPRPADDGLLLPL